MKFEEWVRVIEVEKDIDGGHLGPAELDEEWFTWWLSAFGDPDNWEIEEVELDDA